jgi:hypothetical protein
MIIEISNAKVTLKDSLTWGEMEKIQDSLGEVKMSATGQMDGMSMKSMRNMQYEILNLAVLDVSLNDGTKTKYTTDWLKSLSIEDATILLEASSNLLQPKKKPITG